MLCFLCWSLFIGALVALYLKFVYVPLPAHAENKVLLQVITTQRKLFVTYPILLCERLGVPHLFVKWQLLSGKLWSKFFLQSKAMSDKVGVFNMDYGGVPVRVYIPSPEVSKQAPVNGCVVFIHGGGWMLGHPRENDEPIGRLVEQTGMHCVSIDYRLSPSHRYPTQVDDCITAIEYHMKTGANQLGVSPEHTVVMGDSAGGTLTAVVCLKLSKRNDLPKFKASVLIYPATQVVNLRTPSYLNDYQSEIGILDAKLMHIFHLEYAGIPITPGIVTKMCRNEHVGDAVKKLDAYKHVDNNRLPKDVQIKDDLKQKDIKCDRELAASLQPFLTNPDFSPMFATDLKNLPPTAVVTVEFDVLRDDGILYQKRLQAEGVDTKWLHYDGTYHGVFNMPVDIGKKMVNDIADYVKEKIVN